MITVVDRVEAKVVIEISLLIGSRLMVTYFLLAVVLSMEIIAVVKVGNCTVLGGCE